MSIFYIVPETTVLAIPISNFELFGNAAGRTKSFIVKGVSVKTIEISFEYFFLSNSLEILVSRIL